jgi:hypothetical protein
MMLRSVNMSIEAHGNSRTMHRTGWILSGIVIAFMAADAGSNLLAIAPVKKAALETGYPLDQMWLIGALGLLCLRVCPVMRVCRSATAMEVIAGGRV